MLTADYVVQYLMQKMGSDEGNYGIRWREYTDEGSITHYIAKINEVFLVLDEAHTITGAFIFLTLFKKEIGKATIREPAIHISSAPIGKKWNAIARMLGLPLLKSPEKPEGLANERIQKNLNSLFLHAVRQCDAFPGAHPTEPEIRKLLDEIDKKIEIDQIAEKELFQTLVFGTKQKDA